MSWNTQRSTFTYLFKHKVRHAHSTSLSPNNDPKTKDSPSQKWSLQAQESHLYPTCVKVSALRALWGRREASIPGWKAVIPEDFPEERFMGKGEEQIHGGPRIIVTIIVNNLFVR